MTNTPFELVGKRLVEDGVSLVFQCIGCGDEVTLLVKDGDELEGKRLVTCPCGAQVNMFFGSPRMGRMLINALKEEGDDKPHHCHSPLLN
jgi:DNA-directed RNA polymerase subunit RPC12/RpoP